MRREKIVDALLEGSILPVMSKETFAELESVLAKPRLRGFALLLRLTTDCGLFIVMKSTTIKFEAALKKVLIENFI
jgi:predicted nucleic acid-binding protein